MDIRRNNGVEVREGPSLPSRPPSASPAPRPYPQQRPQHFPQRMLSMEPPTAGPFAPSSEVPSSTRSTEVPSSARGVPKRKAIDVLDMELSVVKRQPKSGTPYDDQEREESVEHDSGSGRKTKRNRVHFSCVECHRRKQRCDRKEPCGQCIARKVPNLCRPFINGVEDPAIYDSDVRGRLTRIEDLLASIIPRLPITATSAKMEEEAPSPAPSTPGPAIESRRPTGASTPRSRARTFAMQHQEVRSVLAPSMEGIMQRNGSEEVFHPRASASPAASHATPPIPLYLSHLLAGSPGRLHITFDPPSRELTEILDTLSESGITKDVIIGLVSSIPEKSLSDSLIELYFREIDWTRYKLNRPAFTRRYVQFFESLQREPHNPPLSADTIKWLPLYFIILAVATLSAPSDMVGGPNGQKSWSRRFYGSSRSAMTCSKALQKDNLDIVYAGLLTARFMLLTRRAAEGSTPLTSAYQLGLYRDGTVLNLSDKREIEFRRRAWAMVYHLDRTTALLVGRPTSISDNHTDTKEPANLDDEEVEAGGFDPRGHPMTQPTEYTQVILRHRLAEIMGKISDHTFAIRPPDYSTVLKLDQELLAWQSNLPPFFAINHPDTSLDSKYHYIFVQRHLLACEFLFARITLHRPYLLRKRDRDNQYLYSREAAIDSAKADLLGRRAFMFEKPVDLKVNSGGYRVLNSYIVLGVAIKLEPNSPRADELRRLLDIVAGLAPDENGRVSEPIVKDELAIVEFLTQKASAPHTTQAFTPRRRLSNASEKRADNASMSFGLPSATITAERRGPASDPAWSFVAPEMAAIDVHQPFAPQPSQSDSFPGPLRPPQNRSISTDHQFASLYSDMPPPNGPRPLQSPAGSRTSPKARDNPVVADEFSIQNLSAAFPNGQLAADNWWNENMAALGMGLPANSSTTGEMGFNPFALAQFGQAEEVDREASETAFLNLLLSTIANNSSA